MSAGAPAFPAVLERRGRFVVALPLFARAGPGGSSGQLSVSLARSGAAPGDLVLVSIRSSRRGGRAEIVRRLGRPDIARDVIEALMIDRGLPRRFDPAVEREAREAAGGAAERRDLRGLATFTIDPSSARDFDDAISAERTPEGTVRVHVHIADVAAHSCAPGSSLDREAPAGDQRVRAGRRRADAAARRSRTTPARSCPARTAWPSPSSSSCTAPVSSRAASSAR